MRKQTQSLANFLGILGISIVLCMGLCIEFFCGQSPCSLCFLQRAAASGVGFGLFCNLVYGVRSQNYALSILWALFGLGTALRHMGLNVCSNVVDNPFFFLSHRLYFWSFITFFLSLLGIACLLCLYDRFPKDKASFSLVICGFILLATPLALNTISVIF